MSRAVEGADFGLYLKRLRASRGLTLRDVERVTEGRVSHPYLSQLENGRTRNPSAIMLHRLATAYAVDFGAMMERAVLAPQIDPLQSVAASVFGVLTPDEEQELLRYLRFIRERQPAVSRAAERGDS